MGIRCTWSISMQASFRATLIQLAWAGSRDAMKAAYCPLIAEAAAQGAHLVCLPELSLSPYFPGTTDPKGFEWAEALQSGEPNTFFAEQAKQHNLTLVGSSFEHTS